MDWVPSAWVHAIWGVAAVIGDSAICTTTPTICPPAELCEPCEPCEKCLPWPHGIGADGAPWQMVKIPVVVDREIPGRDCTSWNSTCFENQGPTTLDAAPCLDSLLERLPAGGDMLQLQYFLPWFLAFCAFLITVAMSIWLCCGPCRHTPRDSNLRSDLEAANAEKEKLKRDLEECKKHGKTLDRQLKAAEKLATDTNEAHKLEVEAMRTELKTANDEITRLKAELEACRAHGERLRAIIDATRNVDPEPTNPDKKALEDQLAACQTHGARLERQITDMQQAATSKLTADREAKRRADIIATTARTRENAARAQLDKLARDREQGLRDRLAEAERLLGQPVASSSSTQTTAAQLPPLGDSQPPAGVLQTREDYMRQIDAAKLAIDEHVRLLDESATELAFSKAREEALKREVEESAGKLAECEAGRGALRMRLLEGVDAPKEEEEEEEGDKEKGSERSSAKSSEGSPGKGNDGSPGNKSDGASAGDSSLGSLFRGTVPDEFPGKKDKGDDGRSANPVDPVTPAPQTAKSSNGSAGKKSENKDEDKENQFSSPLDAGTPSPNPPNAGSQTNNNTPSPSTKPPPTQRLPITPSPPQVGNNVDSSDVDISTTSTASAPGSVEKAREDLVTLTELLQQRDAEAVVREQRLRDAEAALRECRDEREVLDGDLEAVEVRYERLLEEVGGLRRAADEKEKEKDEKDDREKRGRGKGVDVGTGTTGEDGPTDDGALATCIEEQAKLRTDLQTAQDAQKAAEEKVEKLQEQVDEAGKTADVVDGTTQTGEIADAESTKALAECEEEREALRKELEDAKKAQTAAEETVDELIAKVEEAETAAAATSATTTTNSADCENCPQTRAAEQRAIDAYSSMALRFRSEIKQAREKASAYSEIVGGCEECSRKPVKVDPEPDEDLNLTYPDLLRQIGRLRTEAEASRLLIEELTENQNAANAKEPEPNSPPQNGKSPAVRTKCERDLARTIRELDQTLLKLGKAQSEIFELEQELSVLSIAMAGSPKAPVRSGSTCEEDCRKAKEKQDAAEKELDALKVSTAKESGNAAENIRQTQVSLESERAAVKELQDSLTNSRTAEASAKRAATRALDKLKIADDALKTTKESLNECEERARVAAAAKPDETKPDETKPDDTIAVTAAAPDSSSPEDPCADVKRELQEARDKVKDLRQALIDASARHRRDLDTWAEKQRIAEEQALQDVMQLRQKALDDLDDWNRSRALLVQDHNNLEKDVGDLAAELQRVTESIQDKSAKHEASAAERLEATSRARPLVPREGANAPPPRAFIPSEESLPKERKAEWLGDRGEKDRVLRGRLAGVRLPPPPLADPDSGAEQNRRDEIRRQMRDRLAQFENDGGLRIEGPLPASGAMTTTTPTTDNTMELPLRPRDGLLAIEAPRPTDQGAQALFNERLAARNAARAEGEEEITAEELLETMSDPRRWAPLVYDGPADERIPTDDLSQQVRIYIANVLHEFEEAVTGLNGSFVAVNMPGEPLKCVRYIGSFRDEGTPYHRFHVRDVVDDQDEELARIRLISRNAETRDMVRGVVREPGGDSERERALRGGRVRAVQRGMVDNFLSQTTIQAVSELPRTPNTRSTQNDGPAQGVIGTAMQTPNADAPQTPTTSEKQSTPESNNTKSSTSTVFITETPESPEQETPAASNPRFYEERGDFVRVPTNRAIAIVDPHRRTKSEDQETGTADQGDGDEVRRNSESSATMRRGLDPESRVYEPSRLGLAAPVVEDGLGSLAAERGSGIPGPSMGSGGAMERQRQSLRMPQIGQGGVVNGEGGAGSNILPGRMGPILPGVRNMSGSGSVDTTPAPNPGPTEVRTQGQQALFNPSNRGPAAAPTTRRPSTRMQPLATQGRPPAPPPPTAAAPPTIIRPSASIPRLTTTSQLPRPAGPGNRMANSIWSDTSASTSTELDAPKTLDRAASPVREEERGTGWLGRGKGDDDDRGDGRGGGRGGGNRGGRGGGGRRGK